MDKEENGKVKWFNNTKGYGFIESDTGKELFVHYTDIQSDGYRTLNKGDTVHFTIQENTKGIQAVKVTKLKSL